MATHTRAVGAIAPASWRCAQQRRVRVADLGPIAGVHQWPTSLHRLVRAAAAISYIPAGLTTRTVTPRYAPSADHNDPVRMQRMSGLGCCAGRLRSDPRPPARAGVRCARAISGVMRVDAALAGTLPSGAAVVR